MINTLRKVTQQSEHSTQPGPDTANPAAPVLFELGGENELLLLDLSTISRQFRLEVTVLVFDPRNL